MDLLATTSKKSIWSIGLAVGTLIALSALAAGWYLFRDGWERTMAAALGLSITYVMIEFVIHFRLFDETRTFALTSGAYAGLGPLWFHLLAHWVPSRFPASSGGQSLVLIAVIPMMAAAVLFAPRLHFSIDDIRRLSDRRD